MRFSFKEDAVFYTLDNIRSFVETGDIVQTRKSNHGPEYGR